jgi:hypothetical protein
MDDARTAELERKALLDAQILQSMATSLREDLPFAFNKSDMAGLLERCAAKLKPGNS